MVDEFRQGLLDTSDEGYAGCCAAIAGMDLREDIKSITAPTLVICGAEDEATPVAMGLVIQEAIADSQLVVLPASAHLATMEQPERATAAILDHLEGYADDRARGMTVRRAVLGDDHVDRAVAAHDAVHRALPGPHHPLRLGRGVGPARPRPGRRAAPSPWGCWSRSTGPRNWPCTSGPPVATASPRRRSPRSCCTARSTAASRRPMPRSLWRRGCSTRKSPDA